jgi:hypothetical protein
MLIENATGIFTGLAGPAMRATGQIRIRDGVIVEIGALEPKPDELRLDARVVSSISAWFRPIIICFKAY